MHPLIAKKFCRLKLVPCAGGVLLKQERTSRPGEWLADGVSFSGLPLIVKICHQLSNLM